jgi:hypothetical protein
MILHQLHDLFGVGMLMDLVFMWFNYVLNFCCYRTSLHIVLCVLELSACKVENPCI